MGNSEEDLQTKSVAARTQPRGNGHTVMLIDMDGKVFRRLKDEAAESDLPLLLQIEPKVGESLAGLIYRAAEENVLPSMATIPLLSGVSRVRKPWTLAKTLTMAEASRIAHLLGVSKREVELRT